MVRTILLRVSYKRDISFVRHLFSSACLPAVRPHSSLLRTWKQTHPLLDPLHLSCPCGRPANARALPRLARRAPSAAERTRRPPSLHAPRWPIVRRPPRDRPPSAVRREARAPVVVRREPRAQSIHASARAPSAARPSSRASSSISDRDSCVLEHPPRQSRPRSFRPCVPLHTSLPPMPMPSEAK